MIVEDETMKHYERMGNYVNTFHHITINKVIRAEKIQILFTFNVKVITKLTLGIFIIENS